MPQCSNMSWYNSITSRNIRNFCFKLDELIFCCIIWSWTKKCGSAGGRGVVKAEYLETCSVYAFHEWPLSTGMMSPTLAYSPPFSCQQDPFLPPDPLCLSRCEVVWLLASNTGSLQNHLTSPPPPPPPAFSISRVGRRARPRVLSLFMLMGTVFDAARLQAFLEIRMLLMICGQHCAVFGNVHFQIARDLQ